MESAFYPEVLLLPFWLLPALLLGPAGAVLIGLLLRRTPSRSSGSAPERDWSVPVVDAESGADSLFHRWDVRFKLVSLVTFAFFIVATRTLSAALLALAVSTAAVLASRVPLQRPFKRLLAMAGFLGMFLVIMPLTAPVHEGDTLLLFQGVERFPLNLRGLLLALVIVVKACAVALLMEPLLATAPLSRTLEGLSRLRVPAKVGQMILLAHRYIFVFLEETRRMTVGMNVRGFRRRTDLETLRVTGNFLGMLFVRSFERTHRVFDAMQARGYEGEFPGGEGFQARSSDWVKSSLFLLIGIALLLWDRLWLAG